MRKNLTFFSFVMMAVIVAATFITATTLLQLAVAIVLYPLLICFAFMAFPRKSVAEPVEKPVATILPVVEPTETVESGEKAGHGITDIDKRVFLSLIGGAGISLFLYSIFNKRGEGLFFKSLPTPGSVSLQDSAGKTIDPAQNQPTDGYKICEMEENVISFYGFTDKDGAWFIMREDTDIGSFRYARGKSDFPGNWSNRANLSYEYYNNVF